MHERGETIELAVPKTAIEFEPRGGISQRPRHQTTAPLPPCQAPLDQPCPLQHTEMLRHRWQRHPVRFSQSERGHFSARQVGKNLAASRMSQGVEHGIERG